METPALVHLESSLDWVLCARLLQESLSPDSPTDPPLLLTVGVHATLAAGRQTWTWPTKSTEARAGLEAPPAVSGRQITMLRVHAL